MFLNCQWMVSGSLNLSEFVVSSSIHHMGLFVCLI